MKLKLSSIASRGKVISIIALVLVTGAMLIYALGQLITTSPWREFGALWLICLMAYGIFMLLQSYDYYRNPGNPWDGELDAFQQQKTAAQPYYLLQIIRKSAETFGRNTRWQFRNVRIYRYSIALLTAVSTIVLGVNLAAYFPTVPKEFIVGVSKDAALVLNTMATTLATLAIFWNVERYWIQNKLIKHQLELLEQELEFEIGREKIDDQAVQKIFSRYQEILRSFHVYWEGALTERDHKQTDSKPSGTA
ncbi:MAG: SLATT domain-containing protein [Bacteroidota bacterium]